MLKLMQIIMMLGCGVKHLDLVLVYYCCLCATDYPSWVVK